MTNYILYIPLKEKPTALPWLLSEAFGDLNGENSINIQLDCSRVILYQRNHQDIHI